REYPLAVPYLPRPTGVVSDEEPEPVRHLRSYSRYLTPRSGLYSLDTWAVFSIYVRNLVITLLSVLPVIAAVILLFRLLVLPFQLTTPDLPLPPIVWVVIALLPLVYAFYRTGLNLNRVREDETGRRIGGRLVQPTPLPPGWLWRDRLAIAICLVLS